MTNTSLDPIVVQLLKCTTTLCPSICLIFAAPTNTTMGSWFDDMACTRSLVQKGVNPITPPPSTLPPRGDKEKGDDHKSR